MSVIPWHGRGTVAAPPATTFSTGLNRPARGLMAVDVDAWSGESAATWSSRLEWALFHAPETGPDETFRQALEAQDSANQSFVYFEFGFAVPDAFTTGMGISKAANLEFLATIGGVFGVAPTGLSTYRAIDMGKPGYGVTIANLAIERMQAVTAIVGGTGYEGVMFDDVNVFDTRLPVGSPSGHAGVPDGYADSTAYKDAIKRQLMFARDTLANAGYKTGANIGAISAWETESFPADDLIGIVQLSSIEFAGSWGDGTPIGEPVRTRLISAAALAASRQRVLNLNNYPPTPDLFNDYQARIMGEPNYISASYGDIQSPFPWNTKFLDDYGTPTAPLVRTGADDEIISRPFSGGRTLFVNMATLDAWSPGPLLPAKLSESSGTIYYVGGAGASDANPGTSGSPWATIQKAFNTLNGGEIARVRAGTYAESVDCNRTGSGASITNPCTVEADTGATVIIQGASGRLKMSTGARYWRIRNIIVDGTNTTTLGSIIYTSGTSQDIEYEGVTAREATYGGGTNYGNGFYSDPTTARVHYYGCLSYNNDNGFPDTIHTHGYYLQGTDHVLANCIARDNAGGWGFHFYKNFQNGMLVNCIGVRNAKAGVLIGGEADATRSSNNKIINSIFRSNGAEGVDVFFGTATFTVTIASPGVITKTGHAAQLNEPVRLTTSGALPTGLTAGTIYYVKTILDANTFTVSATPGGAVINTSGTQSGTHTMQPLGMGNICDRCIANGNTATNFTAENGAPTYTNTLTTDPLFTDLTNNNYHLQGGSPAINAGDANYTPGFDYYGDVRIQADIGVAQA